MCWILIQIMITSTRCQVVALGIILLFSNGCTISVASHLKTHTKIIGACIIKSETSMGTQYHYFYWTFIYKPGHDEDRQIKIFYGLILFHLTEMICRVGLPEDDWNNPQVTFSLKDDFEEYNINTRI